MSDQERIDVWTADLHLHGRVELRSPRWRLALNLLIAIGFTICGAWMVRSGGDLKVTVFGWAAIAFFGVLGIPAIGWGVVTGGRRVIVTRTGLEVSGGFSVPWTDVADVGVFRMRRTRLVLLRLEDEAAQRRALAGKPIAGALREVNNSITRGNDLALPSPMQHPEALAMWLAGLALGTPR